MLAFLLQLIHNLIVGRRYKPNLSQVDYQSIYNHIFTYKTLLYTSMQTIH